MKTLVKMLAAIVGTAMITSPPVHAQSTGPKVADAKPGDVRVIATAAIRDPLNAVRKQAEATVGKPIVAEYGSARGNLKDLILKGQDFEVAMLLPDVDDEVQAAGKIVPGRSRSRAYRWRLACAARHPILMSAHRLRSRSRC
jgi:ABC-type molybdate transport system substrate-binding protein